MAFQSVPDTAQFTAFFEGPDGTNASFSLYSRNTLAPWDESQLNTIEADFRQAVTDYMAHVSNEWSFVRTEARDLEVEFGRVQEYAFAAVVGSLAVASLPANVAVVGSFRGQPGSAPRSGRIYLLPPTEAQVTGNLLSAGAVTDLQGDLEDLGNSMSASGPAQVLVSRYSGSTLVDMPDGQRLKKPTKRLTAVTNLVASRTVKTRVDSQRRRLPDEG